MDSFEFNNQEWSTHAPSVSTYGRNAARRGAFVASLISTLLW